jgi:hypothetical protein
MDCQIHSTQAVDPSETVYNALQLRSIPDERQFLIHLKKYKKFGFLFIIRVLPAAQGFKQRGILFLPNFRKEKSLAFVSGPVFME